MGRKVSLISGLIYWMKSTMRNTLAGATLIDFSEMLESIDKESVPGE
jgi:hypothetical protein